MRLVLIFVVLCLHLTVSAQIGYQVTLLNTATGEPRANETVNVGVSLTDKDGSIIYENTQQATTDEFGILSLAVGTEKTFDNVDWNKLPFFISATVDGTLVGKQQVLSVPVAEYAKRSGTTICLEELYKNKFECSWVDEVDDGKPFCYTYYFYPEGKGLNIINGVPKDFLYVLEGDKVIIYRTPNDVTYIYPEILTYFKSFEGFIPITRSYHMIGGTAVIDVYKKIPL